MTSRRKLLLEEKDLLAPKVGELHQRLRQADPYRLAKDTGAGFLPAGAGQGTFYLPLWDQEISLTFPEFIGRNARTGQLLATFDQALLAYYFTLSDGTPKQGKWISFSELPDGRFYIQAFQSYTGQVLAKAFGNNGVGFGAAAEKVKGFKADFDTPLGDIAYCFRVLPRVSLLALCWLGDEDFPASYRILFDGNVCHHLSTDGCAIIGSTLTRRLIKAMGK